MGPRSTRALVLVATLLAGVTLVAPAASAAWRAGGTGASNAKAGTITKPVIASAVGEQCSSKNDRKITLSVTGLSLDSGRFEVARANNSGGQNFSSIAAGTFTASGFSYADTDIAGNRTYYYSVRVRPPAGEWVSVASDEVDARCQ